MSASISRHGSSQHGQIGPFFLAIDGCYTWQDLKDLIREKANHGIWTEMAVVYPSGRTGERGWARVQRPDEAERLYKHLDLQVIEGRRLRVHLYDISGPQAKLSQCNCESVGAPCIATEKIQVNELRRVADHNWQRIDFTQQSLPTQDYRSSQASTPFTFTPLVTANPASLVAEMNNMQIESNSLMYAAPSVAISRRQPYMANQYQTPAAIIPQMTRDVPVYAHGAAGTPVNVSQGAVRTESRGVFVAGLNYKATESQVHSLFGCYGKVVKCEVIKDPVTQKSRGSAVIRYSKPEEAKKAIKELDGKVHWEMKMTVRFDKEVTAVLPAPTTSQSKTKNGTQPTIANGSGRK